MKILASDLSNATLKENDSANIVNINNAIVSLLSNDLMLFCQNAYTPQTWERKWINDSSVQGYPRGYCVWYNVEELQEFTNKNKAKILRYVSKDMQLKTAYEKLESTQEKSEFLQKVVTGYQDRKNGIIRSSLFELGNLASPAAIYISTRDNNKQLPTNASWWKEFVINDDSGSKIRNFLSGYAAEIMQNHIDTYHLGNNYTSAWLNGFLKKDMTNLEKYQIYNSHQYQTSSEGFDYVRLYAKCRTDQTRLINCVLKTYSKYKAWYISDAENYTANGVFTANGATQIKQKMAGCNNYLSDNIELAIDNIVGTNQTIAGITYTASKSMNAVPQKTINIDDIENRVSAYNATFKIVPISTALSSSISEIIDLYSEKETEYVEYYQSVAYSYKNWFRQWNSGYLEHGGIVKIPANAVSVEVKLDWQYNHNGRTCTAPIYDYPESQFSVYGSHDMLDVQRNIRYNKDRNLKSSRYIVNLTPINNDYEYSISGNGSSYPAMPNVNEVYASNEVTQMTNKSFSIVVEPRTEASYVSYYVSGYKSNLER